MGGGGLVLTVGGADGVGGGCFVLGGGGVLGLGILVR